MSDFDLLTMPQEFKKQSKPLWSRNCERHMKEERDKLENGSK